MRTGMITLVLGMSAMLLRRSSAQLDCNDRHFVKEDLPRIQYANPAVDIQVNRLSRTKLDAWKPEIVVETSAYLSPYTTYRTLSFCGGIENGVTHKLNMEGKWSSAIYTELMDLTAGSWWQKWKQQQSTGGQSAARVPPPQRKTGASAVLP